MGYSEDLHKVYALRAIQNHKMIAQKSDYDFTLITTTLLAILSSLLPDEGEAHLKFEKLTISLT